MSKSTGAYDIYNGLIPEMRKEGHSLQAIGDACGGISKERVRQIIAKYYPGTQVLLLSEAQASKMLGFRLECLRRKNLIILKKTGNRFLYDRNALEKAMLIYYSVHFCKDCGKIIPVARFRKYCPECAQIRHRNYYPFKTPKQQREHLARNTAWQKAHPERVREIHRKAMRKKRREHFTTTTYIVTFENKTLPIGAKFQAIGSRQGCLLLADKSEIPWRCVKKC